MMRNFHNIGPRLAPKLKCLIPALLLAGGPMLAGENAILTNGFRIHADRHETRGETVKLFSGSGFTELPVSQIVTFEQEEYVPPPPTAPVEMATLTPVAVASPAAAAVPGVDQPLDPKRLAAEAAKRNNLPESLVRSIMHAESGFRPDALSPKGAIGLMQLMPGTARDLHADPRDPRQNVEAGMFRR